MSTVNQAELKAIKVLKFMGKESEWDHLIEKFVALTRARGFQGYCWVQRGYPEQTKTLIERMMTTVMNYLKQKEKKRLRQVYGNAYINLQLSCEELRCDLVSLAKTEELPDGCTRDAWERLTSEYDLNTRLPCCQCFNKINWKMSVPISQFG